MVTITTESGRTRLLPSTIDPAQVAGLDEAGRIVVDWFGAREAFAAGKADPPHLFGLTLCCNASDKGCEDGVYCRGCYGSKPNADSGNYLFCWGADGFVGLDPVVSTSGEPGLG